MYDPTVGRFFTEDPSDFEAGDLNLYRYVSNNPLNRTDPTGLCGYGGVLNTTFNLQSYAPSVLADLAGLRGAFGSTSTSTYWPTSGVASYTGFSYSDTFGGVTQYSPTSAPVYTGGITGLGSSLSSGLNTTYSVSATGISSWNTSTDPKIGDKVANYKNLGEYPNGFTMDLDFQFPKRAGGNFVTPTGYKKEPRASFCGNSGVYIYNAIEIQIIDQNRIGDLGDPVLRGTGSGTTVKYQGKQPEFANTLVTGIPYGVGAVSLTNSYNTQGKLVTKPTNNLNPSPDKWNHMNVTYAPMYAINDVTGQPDTGWLIGGYTTVSVNGVVTFQDAVLRGTGQKKDKPLSNVTDRNVYLQNHHGSAVSFKNITIQGQ
jgi:hypothetical protein